MKKTYLLLSVFIWALSVSISAQVVDPVSVGFRGSPDGGGLTVKFFLDPHVVIEGQVNGSGGFYHEPDNGPGYGPSFTIVGLLEYNIIFTDPSWRIFLGPGMHVGSWDRYDHRADASAEPTQGILGLDAILGVEYLFRSIPLGLSADVKPAIDLSVERSFFPNNMFGLSARYYFGHRVRMNNVERVEDVAPPME